MEVTKSFEYKPNEFLVIQTGAELQSGRQYVVRMTFGASLVTGLIGFYKSTYTNKKLNTTRYNSSSTLVSNWLHPGEAVQAS